MKLLTRDYITGSNGPQRIQITNNIINITVYQAITKYVQHYPQTSSTWLIFILEDCFPPPYLMFSANDTPLLLWVQGTEEYITMHYLKL